MFIFLIDCIEEIYNTCPDFPEIIWKVTSVVLAFIAVFGIVSNLTIVAAFIKNNSVSLPNELLSEKRTFGLEFDNRNWY